MKNARVSPVAIGSFVLISLAGLTGQSLFGQTQTTGPDYDMFKVPDKAVQTTPQTPGQIKVVALESTIDPATYYVGPSDIFSVNIWINPPLNFQLPVTPEGTLIIPTIGEVKVADTTLAEVKRRVKAEIRKKYLFGDATVTLLVPRPVVITVTGRVVNPGSYILASNNRTDKAIEEANKIQRTQSQYDQQIFSTTSSTRNIRIRRKDGTIIRADITKFLATKEDRWNPYLREGDVIVVPRNDYVKNVIGVYGEVNAPGRYEFAEGDSIKDALQIAYGFTSGAISDSVELSRLSKDGRTLNSRIVNARAIVAREAPDIPLEPGDRIVVFSRPDSRADYRISIAGEVVYPGTYPITRDQTRLSSVIWHAGGFTRFASLKTAVVIRRSVLPDEIALERLESLRGGVSSEDSANYYLETNLRIQKEVVNVDFSRLFEQGDSTQDIILKSDDIVIVPSIRGTIYVYGQVVTPGHVPYVAGAKADYYVQQAGGFTERARDGDLKIVKARTRQWLSPDETSIEDGDYVWVPKTVDRSFGYYLNMIGQTAAIISVGLSVVLLTLQMKK